MRMLTSLSSKINTRHTALLVIDIQNDFLHPKGFIPKQTKGWQPVDTMVDRLIQFIENARRYQIPIIYTANSFNSVTNSPVIMERWRRIWPGIKINLCLEGTWGADLYRLSPHPGETIVYKHRYSAFLHTDLDMLLRNLGVKTVIVTGYTTNACVETTARDAYMRDYYVVIAGDCCACQDAGLHEATLKGIEKSYGLVTTSRAILDLWSGMSKVKSPVK